MAGNCVGKDFERDKAMEGWRDVTEWSETMTVKRKDN